MGSMSWLDVIGARAVRGGKFEGVNSAETDILKGGMRSECATNHDKQLWDCSMPVRRKRPHR